MRTEVKLGALFVALVGIPLAAYLYFNSNRGPDVIPIDKSAVDKKVGAGVPLNPAPANHAAQDAKNAAQPPRTTRRPDMPAPGSAEPRLSTPPAGPAGHGASAQPAGANPGSAANGRPLPGPRDDGVQLPPPIGGSSAEPRPVAGAASPPTTSGPPATTATRENQSPEPPRRRDGAGAAPPASPNPAPQSQPANAGNQGVPPSSGDSGPARTVAPSERNQSDRRSTPATPAPTTYTVSTGDTLIGIARQHYGEAKYWRALLAANQLTDASKILVGKSLRIPTKAEADQMLSPGNTAGQSAPEAGGARPGVAREARPPTEGNATGGASRRPSSQPVAATNGRDGKNGSEKPSAGRSTYVVGQGDTLQKIAANVLKNPKRWREIYELNRDRLKSPDVVQAGIELKLPPLENTAVKKP